MRRTATRVLMMLAALASPAAAHDEPAGTSSDFVWRYSPGNECVPPPGLHRRIAELVGVPEASLHDKLRYLEVEVSRRAPGGWGARLKVTTPAGSGERAFEAESCAALVDGTVLIVALAVDPNLHLPSPSQPSPPPPPPAPAPSAPPRAVAPARAPRGTRLVLRPLVAADVGLLPGPALAYGLAGGVVWPGWRIEVDGTGQPGRQTVRQAGAGGELRVVARAGLRACRTGTRDRLGLDVCLGAAAAWMRGTGTDITEPATDDTFWLAGTAGIAAGLRLASWLWLRVELHGGWSPVRPSFTVEGVGQLYRPPSLTGRVAIGIEARF